MIHIDDDALTCGFNHLHGAIELFPAFATLRTEDIARHATGVHTAENRFIFFPFTFGKHYMLQTNGANNTDGVVRMEYKVVWLDSNGAEIPSVVSTWQPMSAAARNVVGLTATAPAPEAVDFRLYIQGAQGY